MAQPVKVKYSKNLKAVYARLKRLPRLVNNAMDASIKRDVSNVIKEFQKGIKRNNFNLEPLKQSTIKSKRSKGYPKPKTPLYGMGESQKNSLINALAIRKIKNGYRLYRRRARHWKADLPLNVLLAIHEQGAIIKNGFGKGILIRIPPRPVVDKAIVRALKKKKPGEPNRGIRRAINQLINQGRENEFKKIIAYAKRKV